MTPSGAPEPRFKHRGRTGPRSPAGKARSARNARKHGLSVSVALDPTMREEVDILARKIAGENGTLLELAARVAEAQLDLSRSSGALGSNRAGVS